jgi:hypothetical protein
MAAEADVTLINASESSDSTPVKELSTQDKLVQSLMETKAPEEDKPKKPKANTVVTTENAITEFPDEDSPQLEEPEAEEETEGEEKDEDEPETDEEDSDEEPETETEESEEVEDEDDEQEVTYTTPDGEEVTLDELKRGYLRQSDYTKKTQEIAQSRQQAQQAFQALEQHNAVVAEHLTLALNIVEPQLAELAQTDWDTLAHTDAYEYAERRALYDQAQIRYQRIQQAAQQTVADEQKRTSYVRAQQLQDEQQKLTMALPDLGDPKVGPKLARSIKEYALSMGLNDKEASSITDHRLIVMLNKARLYDELNQSSLSAAKKKLGKSPKKVARAGQPSSKADQNSTKTAQLRNRVKSSGSVDDLVELLLAN